MVSVDKMLYEGSPRLSILTGIFVCLQMSDGGQIQQQDTIPSIILLLNTISVVRRFFKSYTMFSVNKESLNNIPNYEVYFFTVVLSCSMVNCHRYLAQNYLIHCRCRIKFLEEFFTYKFRVSSYIHLEITKIVRVCRSALITCQLHIDS